MANLDWLRGDQFHSEIEKEVNKFESNTDLDYSDYGIDYLKELFEQNKESNLITESRKSEHRQRSIEDARDSIRRLLETAAAHAQDDRKSKFIRRSDLKEAYRIHYCGVWPFCGGDQ